jgi:5,10-methylenetetrahydrofolate reductase
VSRLERLLRAGTFVVTAEVVPPRSAGPDPVTQQARGLVGYADAANVTDNPRSSPHMSPVAGSALVAAAGVEPVMQVTTRDRNRLGLAGDLLGGWAMGARNVLCLTGDPPTAGEDPVARGVFDLSVLDLVRLAAGRLAGPGPHPGGGERPGRADGGRPAYFVGVADVPLSGDYDFGRIEAKADAGARFVQTQIVFDVDAFGEWAVRAGERGLFERLFVLAGVAVPAGAGTARYLRDRLPGVVVPDAVVGRLEEAGAEAPDEGVRLAVEVVDGLRGIAGVAGVHVMGLGRTEPVRRVVAAAGLLPRPVVA